MSQSTKFIDDYLNVIRFRCIEDVYMIHQANLIAKKTFQPYTFSLELHDNLMECAIEQFSDDMDKRGNVVVLSINDNGPQVRYAFDKKQPVSRYTYVFSIQSKNKKRKI
jgi:hypothetical protein